MGKTVRSTTKGWDDYLFLHWWAREHQVNILIHYPGNREERKRTPRLKKPLELWFCGCKLCIIFASWLSLLLSIKSIHRGLGDGRWTQLRRILLTMCKVLCTTQKKHKAPTGRQLKLGKGWKQIDSGVLNENAQSSLSHENTKSHDRTLKPKQQYPGQPSEGPCSAKSNLRKCLSVSPAHIPKQAPSNQLHAGLT